MVINSIFILNITFINLYALLLVEIES